MIEKVTYYRNGKKVSEEKAKKTDPKKIEKRVEYISVNNAPKEQVAGAMSVAMPNANDPMYKNWMNQLQTDNKPNGG